MLKTLRIRDVAVIEDITVEFGPGLNLLTGETGAGKSIVVDSLGLAAGDRADATLVRSGAERATVEAVFDLPPDSAVRGLLEARGLDPAGEEIAVRREVSASGGGRAFLNGSPVALAVLREIGGVLVELHGQHEHQSLLLPERHLDLLDRFAGHDERVRAVAEAYDGVAAAAEELGRLDELGAARGQRAELLRGVIREIDAVGPRAGETDDLSTERLLLRNQGKVAELLEEAVSLLHDGETTAGSLAARAALRTEELSAIDPSLRELARRVESARVELDDAGAALRDYRQGKRFEPGRLEQVESRLAALERLRLRHGADEEEVLRARDAAAEELSKLDDLDSARESALAGLRAAEERYASAAASLGESRRAAAARLAKSIREPLRDLGLVRATVELEFSPARGRATDARGGIALPVHRRGAERVELLLSANPGEPARPLVKVASGGELSRVMLALHGVVEDAGGERVLVFDEVDAGIGGATADAVGAGLARASRKNQSLCVTHLPQVAAHGDRHYHVRKKIVRGRTTVDVVALDAEGRVLELARMLGGREVTEASRRNAEALLASASGAPRARQRR